MTAKRRALLLYNDDSGAENSSSQLGDGIALLQSAGIEVIRPVVEGPDNFNESIKQYQNEIDRIIVGGGDGTLRGVAAALKESKLPLGILPLGTANDLARSLQIPKALPDACAVIAAGRRRTIDLGMVNDQYFFNVAHIGLGVQVTRQLSKEIKLRWGPLGYARSVLDAFKANRSFRAEVAYDGKTLRLHTIQIAVGNGRHYGGGMTIDEDATVDDELLHLYSLRPQSWWQLLFKALAIKSGRLKFTTDAQTVRAQALAISTHKALQVSADGEIITYTPARFRVIPKALEVYIP